MGKFLAGALAFYTVASIGAMALNLPVRMKALDDVIERTSKRDARNRARAAELARSARTE